LGTTTRQFQFVLSHYDLPAVRTPCIQWINGNTSFIIEYLPFGKHPSHFLFLYPSSFEIFTATNYIRRPKTYSKKYILFSKDLQIMQKTAICIWKLTSQKKEIGLKKNCRGKRVEKKVRDFVLCTTEKNDFGATCAI
jgi:hypothetical protein